MRTKTFYSSSLLSLLLVAALVATSLSSTAIAKSPQASTTSPTTEQLDKMFLVGPSALGSLGMRTVWQSKVNLQDDESAQNMFVTDGDSVFVEDSGCHISRVLSRDGRSLWKNACGRATDKVRGVNRVLNGNLDEVLITLDNAIVGLDASTGVLSRGHKLTRLPRTSGVVYGKHLIFGAKGGQIVWQQYAIGYFWLANDLGGAIERPPILIGSNILAASTSGQVALLNADTTRQVWRKTLGGAIKGTMGIGADAIYAACEDHSISALELSNGNLRWRHQTNKPLTNNVFCDDDLVYLQVTGEGLVALVAKPLADDATFSRDGVVKWKCTATGTPLCRVGSRIMLWDSSARMLTTVETSNGIVVATVALPKVAHLVVTGPIDPDMYLLSTNGILQRCETTARDTATDAATAAKAIQAADSATAPAASPDPSDQSEP